jgi:hypothetical protein
MLEAKQIGRSSPTFFFGQASKPLLQVQHGSGGHGIEVMGQFGSVKASSALLCPTSKMSHDRGWRGSCCSEHET